MSNAHGVQVHGKLTILHTIEQYAVNAHQAAVNASYWKTGSYCLRMGNYCWGKGIVLKCSI